MRYEKAFVLSSFGSLLMLACSGTAVGAGEAPEGDASSVDPVDAAPAESFVPEADADVDAGNDSGPAPCPSSGLRVFVSSNQYGANLGGRGGGDTRCKTLADAANLGATSTWVAWLSSTQVNAVDLLPPGGSWCLVDRTTFVATREELVTGSLRHRIDVLESGVAAVEPGGAPTAVWTGTLENGLRAANTCDDWTKDGALTLGARGNYSARNGEWTRWPGAGGVTAVACSNANRLYCFETK